MPAALRIELFASDVNLLVEFYTRVLQFAIRDDRRGADSQYVALQRGSVRIGIAAAWEPLDPATRHVPQGNELVIEVEDLVLERDRVVDSGWQLEEDITTRSWGLSDFRLRDPDGYYLRFTTAS